MARHTIVRNGDPAFPEHPRAEHQWRLERARKLLRQAGLDALVLARNVNVHYMTGTRFVFVAMQAPVAVAPQSVSIVTADADIYCQRFGPFDSDAVSIDTAWSESLESYDDELELVSILSDYGVGKGSRIGTEWGPGLCAGINPLKFLELKGQLEGRLGAEVVDGTPVVFRMTSVKSGLEIERMRVAVGAAARAMERVLDTIEIGMNELDVSRMASQFMLDEGGDGLSHAQVMAQGDGRRRMQSCNALDRSIKEGWVNFDIGCTYRRYGSDINRGIFLGRKPTADETRLYNCRTGLNELMDRAIRPGVSVDDLLSQMQSYVASEGCELKKSGATIMGGHGIGLENYQRPNLIPSSAQPEVANADGQVVFEPGMMFTYEMPVRIVGVDNIPVINIEDDVVVTDDGVEVMSKEARREMTVKL